MPGNRLTKCSRCGVVPSFTHRAVNLSPSLLVNDWPLQGCICHTQSRHCKHVLSVECPKQFFFFFFFFLEHPATFPGFVPTCLLASNSKWAYLYKNTVKLLMIRFRQLSGFLIKNKHTAGFAPVFFFFFSMSWRGRSKTFSAHRHTHTHTHTHTKKSISIRFAAQICSNLCQQQTGVTMKGLF